MNQWDKSTNFKEGAELLLNKPVYWTSFDVVRKVRNILRRYDQAYKKLKVGHAGTLDPLASGLIVLCTGKATKRIPGYQAMDKEYIATLQLGETTPSYDLETSVDQTHPTDHITQDKVKQVLTTFLGTYDQIPPQFSAKRVKGERAYHKARKGEEVALQPKPVTINEMELMDYEFPRITIRIDCSKGTYIRAIARDIGERLQSGAYIYQLQRTRIGDFKLSEALSIEDFEQIFA